MKQVLILLLVISASAVTFAIKNAPPDEWQSFVINVDFDGQRLRLDPGFPQPFDTSIAPPQPPPAGPYTIEINSIKGTILYKTAYQPTTGGSILHLPYFLNTKEILIKNSQGQVDVVIPTAEFLICNENDRCEPTETNLCPRDCPRASNDRYPSTPGGLIDRSQQPQLGLTTVTIPVAPPANTFTILALIFAIGLVTLVVVIGGFYLFRRK